MDEKIVYVCSPYRGDIEDNKEFARRACRIVLDAGHIPYAPHLLFPQFMDEDKDREKAMLMGLTMLRRCDELWMFPRNGHVSQGMRIEKMAAVDLHIATRQIDLKEN